MGTNDPRVWPALEKAARRVNVSARLVIIRAVETFEDASEQKKNQAIRFLRQFLSDTTSVGSWRFYDPDQEDSFVLNHLAIRDQAAYGLARLLNMKIRPRRNWSAIDWMNFRDKVEAAVRRKQKPRKSSGGRSLHDGFR